MSATWPVTLPQRIPEEGYSEQSPDNVLRTQMSYGPMKTRRRGTAAPTPITVELDLTPEQWDTFLSFWVETIFYGAVPFEWVHPRTREPAMFIAISYSAIAENSYQRVMLELEMQP